jgi:peptidyl-dipeptidase Dcp
MRRWLAILVVLLVSVPVLAQEPAKPQAEQNPFFVEWTTPFGVPPFASIRPEHFMPAFQEAMAKHKKEIEAIATAKARPTFANTLEAMDASGQLLAKVQGVFGNLTGAETNEQLQAISKQLAPVMAAHRDDITLNEALFARVEAVWNLRAILKLNPEQAMLLERTYKNFVRGGAKLGPEQKTRLRAINGELASMGVRFGDNLLKEMNSFKLVIDTKENLAGLPEGVVAAAADAAKRAKLEGKWVFTLHAPSIWPFMQYADNRELRKQLFTAYITRGDHNDETDNKAIVAKTAALRTERAQLLGYKTFADFNLEESMAKTPAKVYELLNRLWTPAKAVAAKEVADMEALIKAEGKEFKLEPWDYFYYAEKVRKARFDLDAQALRPYFQLDAVRDGAFYVASKLYGIKISPLKDMPVYNPEVKVFEVKDADGSHLAVFYSDYFPRPGKRGGAWSSSFRGQRYLKGKDIRPIVVNVGNFSRPTGDTPALLSGEEVETLFHEFGHALHQILSRIHYRSIAGTPRDFVELPSQIMEHWAFEPEVLRVYAKHYKTGEVIPAELIDKIDKSGKFNQGFATVEYLAASLLDMDWHTITETKELDPLAFEKATLDKIAMPAEIVPRYRSPYFQHIFAGGGYAAGYYSYIWSEVLDSDAFELFKQRGLFDQATAKSFRDNILSKGGTIEAMTMYKRFRGAEPSVEPLLVKRGLK